MSLDDWMKKPKKPASKKTPKKPPAKKKKEPPVPLPEPEMEESKPSVSELNQYNLKCSRCKFTRKLRVTGELKVHHKLCKKCGNEMKVLKAK